MKQQLFIGIWHLTLPVIPWPPPSQPRFLHPELLCVVPHVPTIWRQTFYIACRGGEESLSRNIRVSLNNVTSVDSTFLPVFSNVTLLFVEQGHSYYVKLLPSHCTTSLYLVLLSIFKYICMKSYCFVRNIWDKSDYIFSMVREQERVMWLYMILLALLPVLGGWREQERVT